MTTKDEHTDHDAKAEWDASAELRAEFGDFNIYRAFRSAEARGAAKMYGGRVITGNASQSTATPTAQAVRPSTGRVRRVLDPATGQWTTTPVQF